MNIWVWVVIALLSYTAASIAFFLSIMGQKYRKQRWYDWPMLTPALGVAYIIGAFNKQ